MLLQDFSDGIVELLWQYSNHCNPVVSAAAFTALANFSEDDFALDDIPLEVDSSDFEMAIQSQLSGFPS